MFIFRLFFNYVLLVGMLLVIGGALMGYGSGLSFMDMYAMVYNFVVIAVDAIQGNEKFVGCVYDLVNGEYIKVCDAERLAVLFNQ